jgi:adenosylcobinamide kinase/adenosylcobinamide-phosphate guanylyltransferase
MLTLITGGARSGKSKFAQSLCIEAESVVYIATAEAIDAEMQQRIAHHRASRPAHWHTIEEPLNVPEAIARHAAAAGRVVLLDCLTVWLNNLLFRGDDESSVSGSVDQLIAASANGNVVVVTNEVGSGIVPESALSRTFRDLQGFANQRVAEAAHFVHLVICGIPVRIKPAV